MAWILLPSFSRQLIFLTEGGMEFIGALSAVFSLSVLGCTFLGTLVGIVAAAIPGFTILMAVILVFPFTFALPPLEGLSTLIGVYVGGFSGGQVAGILLGIPGTPSSICTVFDGYPMAKNGRAGEALGLGIFSSFFGGLIGVLALIFFIKPMADFGLKFGPWEIFSLVLFSLTLIASLGGQSFFKGLLGGFLGLSLSVIGTDSTGGVLRFTFGLPQLEGGISLLPVLIGLFAIPHLIGAVTAQSAGSGMREAAGNAVLSSEELKIPYRKVFALLRANWKNLVRSSLLGGFVGALPGEGGTVANFLSYDQAKRAARPGEHFGSGEPAGVIASESSNNAVAGGSLIPTLALGIPGSAVMAVMLGVLMTHSITPGPGLFRDEPQLVYGLFAALVIAHFFMLAIQLGAGNRVFLKIACVPAYLLVPVVLVMCAIGCYALNNQLFDVWLFLGFGVVGYLLEKADFPLAPIVIGLILGGLCEENLRQALSADPHVMTFFTRPISAAFFVLTVLSAVFCARQSLKGRKGLKAMMTRAEDD